MGSHKDPWPHDEEREAWSGRLADWLLLIVAAVLLAVFVAVRLGR